MDFILKYHFALILTGVLLSSLSYFYYKTIFFINKDVKNIQKEWKDFLKNPKNNQVFNKKLSCYLRSKLHRQIIFWINNWKTSSDDMFTFVGSLDGLSKNNKIEFLDNLKTYLISEEKFFELFQNFNLDNVLNNFQKEPSYYSYKNHMALFWFLKIPHIQISKSIDDAVEVPDFNEINDIVFAKFCKLNKLEFDQYGYRFQVYIKDDFASDFKIIEDKILKELNLKNLIQNHEFHKFIDGKLK